jgi:hypothetical protein
MQTERPRDPKTVVLEAELLASTPERVRGWLEESLKQNGFKLHGRDEDLELALLARGDALITISLAKLASSFRVVQEIMAGPAREDKAVRLAVLLNEVVGEVAFGGMPDVLLKQRKEVDAFVALLDEQETATLFSNPTLADDFLIDFFEQKGPWQTLDEARRFAAIRALQANPRMQVPYDGIYDGYAEYTHNKVFSAAWDLSSKVPVTPEWAAHLCWLYEKTPAESWFLENPQQIAVRWVPDPADTEHIESEKQALERGDLGVFAQMRKGLARLSVAAAHNADERGLLAKHDDSAVRAAFYSNAPMTVVEMKQADERDPLLSFEQMMWNSRVWQTKAHREQLHAMAWDSKRDPKSYMDPQNMFNARRDAYREQYPDWFKDEDEPPDPEAQPLNAGTFDVAVEGVKTELLTGNDLARATHLYVLKLLKRTEWLGWGVAALLVIVLLWRR